MTNILVTGGTGFLGSSLVKRLVDEKNNVTVFDNNFRGSIQNIENNKNLKLINGDIRSLNQVKNSYISIN